jgi:hypothetical protein
MKYYYTTDGIKKQGPLELSDILEMQKRNQLPATTKVREEGYTLWESLPSAKRNERLGYILTLTIGIAFIYIRAMSH